MKFVSDALKGLLQTLSQQEVVRAVFASQGQGLQRTKAAAEVPGYWPQAEHSYLPVV